MYMVIVPVLRLARMVLVVADVEMKEFGDGTLCGFEGGGFIDHAVGGLKSLHFAEFKVVLIVAHPDVDLLKYGRDFLNAPSDGGCVFEFKVWHGWFSFDIFNILWYEPRVYSYCASSATVTYLPCRR